MKRSSLLTICLAFCLPVAFTTFAFAQDAGARHQGIDSAKSLQSSLSKILVVLLLANVQGKAEVAG